jgi:hypothetical protein
MEMTCEIVKDLLPLYHDDVCSNESRIIIEEHLLECDICKKYLDNMKSDLFQSNTEKTSEQAKWDILKGIKKKLLKKNIMISAISVICAIAVLFGGFMLICTYQLPIYYKNGLVSVKVDNNGRIDVLFNGDDYFISHKTTTEIEKDDIKQRVVYIYYTDTIWTRNFSKPQKDKEYRMSINTNNGEEAIENISAVYYLDYSEGKKEFPDTSKAVLLWKK